MTACFLSASIRGQPHYKPFEVDDRGTSLIRNNPPLGPYRRPMPRALWWSKRGRLFLMLEVPLYFWI